jgi:hypothetical protein
MTLPSSKQRIVLFPSELVYPVAPMHAHAQHFQLDAMDGETSPWLPHAVQSVATRLSHNKHKDEGRLGRGLHGGVITSSDGKRILSQRLRERTTDFVKVKESNWATPAQFQAEYKVAPTDTSALDMALTVLTNVVQTGVVDNKMIDNAVKVLTTILSVGDVLTPDEVTEYYGAVEQTVAGPNGGYIYASTG